MSANARRKSAHQSGFELGLDGSPPLELARLGKGRGGDTGGCRETDSQVNKRSLSIVRSISVMASEQLLSWGEVRPFLSFRAIHWFPPVVCHTVPSVCGLSVLEVNSFFRTFMYV